MLALYYQDWRAVLKTDSRPLAARQADSSNVSTGTFGGHQLSAVETGAGTVDALLWGVAKPGAGDDSITGRTR